MVFVLKTRPDRIGTEILSFLFQFYFCYKNNYFLHLNYNNIRFKDSIFMKCILKIINDFRILIILKSQSTERFKMQRAGL